MGRRNKFRYQPPMTNAEFTSAMLRDILDREPQEGRSNDIPVTVLSNDEARAMARKALLDSDAAYYSRRQ